MDLRKQIMESLIALATISGKELNEITLKAFVNAVSDLNQADVLHALQNWLRTSKGFPYPADIREKIKPDMSGEDNGIMAAAIIRKAISAHGSNWSGGVFTGGKKVFQSKEHFFDIFEDAAKFELGELAWEVVKQYGGWAAICEFNASTETGIFQAQIRELAKTICRRAKSGLLEEKPSLPKPSHEIRQLINKTMKENKSC